MTQELESSVVASLKHLRDGYQKLKVETDQLAGMENGSSEFQSQLASVLSERDVIESLHGQSRDLHARYRNEATHSSSEVRMLTEEIANLIQHLVLVFNQLESDTREARERLRPQVNTNLKAAQMKSAYQRRAV